MSTPEVFSFTKIYTADDANPAPIVVDNRFRYNTITVQPLDLTGVTEPLSQDLVTEGNSVLTGTTGSVSFKATPPYCYLRFDIPDSTIDLATPSFLNSSIPIFKLYPTLTAVSGCTHVAVTVTGFTS